MKSLGLTFVAVVLTLAFLADTGWQLYRLTQNQPTHWWGMLLLIPIKLLVNRMAGTDQASAGKSSASP